MAVLQIASPLIWPSHIPKTERLARQVNPQFQLNMQEREAIAFVEDEILRTAQVTSAVLSCDALNINSTLPTQYLSKDSGAALNLTIEEVKFHLCCDRWQSLAHNIYALHLGLRYYRQLAEWGLGTMPILMAGFRENTIHAGVGASTFADLAEWQALLGLGPTATLDDANAIYRVRAKNIGEDNPEELRALNIAIQEARQVLGQPSTPFPT